jgi:hypothetical protein
MINRLERVPPKVLLFQDEVTDHFKQERKKRAVEATFLFFKIIV